MLVVKYEEWLKGFDDYHLQVVLRAAESDVRNFYSGEQDLSEVTHICPLGGMDTNICGVCFPIWKCDGGIEHNEDVVVWCQVLYCERCKQVSVLVENRYLLMRREHGFVRGVFRKVDVRVGGDVRHPVYEALSPGVDLRMCAIRGHDTAGEYAARRILTAQAVDGGSQVMALKRSWNRDILRVEDVVNVDRVKPDESLGGSVMNVIYTKVKIAEDISRGVRAPDRFLMFDDCDMILQSEMERLKAKSRTYYSVYVKMGENFRGDFGGWGEKVLRYAPACKIVKCEEEEEGEVVRRGDGDYDGAPVASIFH